MAFGCDMCVYVVVCALRMKKTVARTSSKIERLESQSGDGAEARDLCGTYNPPKPDSLEVGVEIEVRPTVQPVTESAVSVLRVNFRMQQ